MTTNEDLLSPGIAMFNASSSHDDEIRPWVAACSRQMLEHFCPAYSRYGIEVVFFADKTKIPIGMPSVPFADRSDVENAIAYHSTGHLGRVVGVVGILTARENGLAPSGAASHECTEAAFDAFCNKWYDMGNGREMAGEVADPVQDQSYKIDGVEVSNFVLPQWFNPQAPHSSAVRFDYLGSLKAPFTRTSGGYFITRSATGTEVQGERPAWKTDDSRSGQRIASAVAS